MSTDYGRSRSREVFRSRYQQRSGSLDRVPQPRYRQEENFPRGYVDDRFDMREPVYDRWVAPRDIPRRSYPRYASFAYVDDGEYPYGPYLCAPPIDNYAPPMLPLRPAYDSYGQGFEQYRDRYEQERPYGYNRYGQDNRYDGEKSAFQQHERAKSAFQQPEYGESRRDQGNLRAEKERQSRSDVKRVTKNKDALENKPEPKNNKRIKFRQSERDFSAAEMNAAENFRRIDDRKRSSYRDENYGYERRQDEREDEFVDEERYRDERYRDERINDRKFSEPRSGEVSRKSSVPRRQSTEKNKVKRDSFAKPDDRKRDEDKVENKVSEIVQAYEQLSSGQDRSRQEETADEYADDVPLSPSQQEKGNEKFQDVFQEPENEGKERSFEDTSEGPKESVYKKDSEKDTAMVTFEEPDVGKDQPSEEDRRKQSFVQQSEGDLADTSARNESFSGQESDARKKSATNEEVRGELNKDSVTDEEKISVNQEPNNKIEQVKFDVSHTQERRESSPAKTEELIDEVGEGENFEVKKSRSPSYTSASDGDKESGKIDDIVNDRPNRERRVKIQEKREICHEKIYTYDKMPPPIPPCTDLGTAYTASKGLKIDDDELSSAHNRGLAVRATYDLIRRQYYERTVDPTQHPAWLQRGEKSDTVSIISQGKEDTLRVNYVDFRCSENSKLHRTFEYELVQDDELPNPVLRRGQTFQMEIAFNDRSFNVETDSAHINFYFGPNPSVPKRTRVVLPISSNAQFSRVPYQWDVRMVEQDTSANSVTVEVSIPSSAPVGIWRCVVETLIKEDVNSRVQYPCNEEIYIIFNPFNKEDSVFVESDEERYEYVINDSGKIYTGSYRNVKGRPWIYGQFDDCVLPAACVLLEMSGVSHAERGNPVKVVKALTSMIKSSRFTQQGPLDNEEAGLVEAKYDHTSIEGKSPHLWSGSVQIIEEFLRIGASPVKYGQCWVMAGLMTTLCRALGLPSRPATAFVSAADTQDTMTVDRYIDRFGDLQQDGPTSDQTGSLWSFHTWCEVWMSRPDQLRSYSGWQATDPGRTFRDFRNTVKGSCGPCPVEALKAGDIGQRDDVDAFFSTMNAYVRYFYEDEESSWGYSPFKQFRHPVSRYVLTKSVGKVDDEGEADCTDITQNYRDDDKVTQADRFKVFNYCRGLKDLPAFEYQAAAYDWANFNPEQIDDRNFDVRFDFIPPESVMIGQAFKVPVNITNNSEDQRTVQINICTRSAIYTGCLGSYIKRTTKQLTLEQGQADAVVLALDHWDYEDKVMGLANVKITVTGFVQETHQSFVDEFDYVFKKPYMNLKPSPDMKVGEEASVTLTFTNPLDISLTDCFFTFEMAGSVRPRTTRVDGDVRPGQQFSYTHPFVMRRAGEHLMVACFTSHQLSDVVGHRTVTVLE